jgi:hypothetical protein
MLEMEMMIPKVLVWIKRIMMSSLHLLFLLLLLLLLGYPPRPWSCYQTSMMMMMECKIDVDDFRSTTDSSHS